MAQQLQATVQRPTLWSAAPLLSQQSPELTQKQSDAAEGGTSTSASHHSSPAAAWGGV